MHDEEVERYLAEFKPRPVRPLGVPPRNERVWPLRLVAAAVILLVGGISLWYLRQETKGTKHIPTAQEVWPTTALRQDSLNTIALTKLALENDGRFETLLADKSRTVLPSFQRENSSLRALAKE